MLTSIHILQTLCALEGRGRGGKGGVGGARGEREEGRGTGGEERSMGREKHGTRKGWGERRQRNKSVILSSDMVNLQEATALGHMQGC